MADIKFGTDGWRAIIAEEYTFRNVRVVSQAVADYVGAGKKVAVGYDTRFLSAEFARASAEVLKANGIGVILSDKAVPTPALSFAVRKRICDLGVMITASHNPAQYNGFKIKTSSGGAAGPEITKAIENLLGVSRVKTVADRGAVREDDLISDYIHFIRSYIDLKKIRKKKFRVLVDAMYGSGDSLLAHILKGTDIRVEFMRNSINPSFGGRHPEPLEDNLQELKARVKKENFDLGIALDGDADRIAVVAGGGVFIHPQKILGLLALHLHEDRGWPGGIVKTICGSTMIDAIARHLGVKLYETPVGFKYISNLMETEDILCGGEEAGGMGVKGYIPERDGSVAGLLLLEMMAYRNKPIAQILDAMEKQFGRYYYVRQDLGLKHRIHPHRQDLPDTLLGKKVVEVKDYDGIKLICEDKSWLMFRASGTEALMRLYSEAKSFKRANALLQAGARIIQKMR